MGAGAFREDDNTCQGPSCGVFVETPPAAVRDLPGTTAVGASPQATDACDVGRLETPRWIGNGKDFDSAWGVSTECPRATDSPCYPWPRYAPAPRRLSCPRPLR